jgi:hypothetical protein
VSHIIIRVSRDEDPPNYIAWSSSDASPWCWGSREEVTKWLTDYQAPGSPASPLHKAWLAELEGRLDRADATGTSSVVGEGSWEDSLQTGSNTVLHRDHIPTLLRALNTLNEEVISMEDLIEALSTEQGDDGDVGPANPALRAKVETLLERMVK